MFKSKPATRPPAQSDAREAWPKPRLPVELPARLPVELPVKGTVICREAIEATAKV